MAVLIFKQGNSESSSLAYAEPLFHTDSNTIILSGSVSEYVNTEVSPAINSGSLYRLTLTDYPNTGSLIVTGDFSGSNLLLDGNATIRGNITMGGSGLDFGDASDDNVVFKADISSSILPNDDDSFDLGSDSQRWKTGYLSNLNLSGSLFVDGGPIDLHSDTYISASAGTFLDVDITGAITINGESTTAISSSGALSLNSETGINIGTTTDKPIDIDASTLDIDASGALTLDSATSISIGTTADKPIDIDSTTLDIDSSGAITINGESTTAISSSGALSIDSETGINIGTTTDKPIDIDSTTLDIDASGAVTVDSTSTISLDGVGNSNFTIDSGNLTINNTTSGNMTLQSAGAIDIDADGGKVTIDGSGGIDIGVESDVAIDIDSSTLDIDASGAITIDGTSTLSIDVDGATNINTSVGGIEINSEAGSLTLDGHTGVDIDASNSGKVAIDGAGGIDIGVASDVAIDIDASTLDIDASGALTIDSATSIGIGTNADKPIDIDSTTFDLDASGNITIDSNGADGIQIGTANSGVPIQIGHTTSETTVNDNLTVTGNFTVNGTTTYVSSSNVTIGDRIIELNYLGASGNGGLYVGDADGTATSGSLLWDSTNDYWIAGAKGTEHKILLQNGDSIISGSGTNNQITTFTGTHGVDSSANLTFDGSILRITGTQEITSHLSGSASASFADLKISDDASIASLTVTDLTNDRVVIVGGGGEIEDSANLTFDGTTLGVTGNVTATASGSFNNVNVTTSQLIGSDLYVGGTIFHKDDTDTKIVFTDDDINITVGNTNMIDFTQDTVSEITINEAAQNLDVRIEGEADNKLFFTDASVSKIGIGTNSPGEKLTIHGNVSGSASGSFNDVYVTGNVRGETLQVISSENNLAEFHSTDSAAKILLRDSDGVGTRISYVGSDDTAGFGQSTTHNELAIHVNNSERVAIGKNHTIPHAVLDVSGSLIVSGTQEIKFGDLTVHETGSFGRVSGHILATNGVISGSSQIDHDATTNFVAGEHFLQSAITTVGTVTTGNVTAILPSGVVSGSSQVSGLGFITASDATSHPNWISSNLVAGNNVTITSSSTTLTIEASAGGGGGGSISGSSQINHDATTGFVSNEHIDHSNVSITGTTGLSGGGDITTNRQITLDVSSGTFTGGVTAANDALGVLSGSAQITAFGFVSSSVGDTLQQVTTAGATTNVATTFSNTTDSTSKTTGALIVGGGLGVNNTINAGGDVIAYASSDERLKDNIKPIENPLDKISQISGNTFDWNSEKQNIYNGKDYGVIAQEIQKVMPELVDTRDSGYLAVKYDKIVPLLIESIKELKREIEELKSK